MEIQKIKQRRECCHLIVNAGFDASLTKKCSEENLIAGCRDIIDMGVSAAYKELPGIQQALLINSAELRKNILQLFQRGIPAWRISFLLKQMDGKEVLKYSIEKLYDVLQDEMVSNSHIALYLRFYADIDLLYEERRQLCKGLDNYYSHQGQEGEEIIRLHGKLFYNDVVSGNMLSGMCDCYMECLWSMAHNGKILRILEIINRMCGGRVQIDDELFKQIEAEPDKIESLLRWSDGFYNGNKGEKFCQRLLENRALLYDLERLRKKVDEGKIQEAHQMIESRASYISFFYNEYFNENWNGKYREDLVIYAVTHKKKAFLSLVRNNPEIFCSIPYNSLLFQKSFYSRVVNINTLNVKNLKQCRSIKCYPEDIMKLLSARTHTFEEVSVLQELPVEYAALYSELQNERVDDRLKVMREIIKRKCLRLDMDISAIAAKLSLYPLSKWMQKDLVHIKDLDADVAMRLLENFDKIRHLVNDIKSVSEARYVSSNAEIFSRYADMDAVRNDTLEKDQEWLQLKNVFGFDQKFVQDNKERIMAFLYEDGAHIMWTYYTNVSHKKEELRRLVSAELLGRFKELKYHSNDLDNELDYPITNTAKHIWMENLYDEDGSLCVWEEDGLLPVMKMGEMPSRTCLSYIDGVYKQCLLASHDSNKKVLYVSWNGNIVMRAAVRLTKGMYGDANKKNSVMAPQLEFADLTREEATENKPYIKNKEFLVLFLERYYEAGIPHRLIGDVMKIVFRLMKRKAEQMGALLVMNMEYKTWKPERMVCSDFSMYISKSKAGEQYVDSLNGSNTVDKEGNYEKNKFLVCVKE